MAIARLDLVEGDLDDRVRRDRSEPTVVADGVLLEVLRHLRDLLVGQPRVGLADVEEPLSVADREGVVREHTTTFAVAPLDAGHDDVDRAQRPLHLEPFHAATAGAVRRPRVLDHQAFVAPLARRRELALECGDEVGPGFGQPPVLGEHDRRSKRDLTQRVATLGERPIEEPSAIALEKIECDEARRHFRAELVGDALAPQARLEVGERHRATLVEREDLSVDDVAPGHPEQRPDQLGIAMRDPIHRPRVELDAIAGLVDLRPDTVVLVLHHVGRREASSDLLQLQHRCREHHADRREVRERGLAVGPVPRAERRIADVAGEHVRAADLLTFAPEGARDGVLEQALAQPDARLPADDLHQIAGLVGVRAGDERAQQLPLGRDAARRGDAIERLGNVRERQRFSGPRALGDEIGCDVAEIGVALVRLGHIAPGLARALEQDVGERAPAD